MHARTSIGRYARWWLFVFVEHAGERDSRLARECSSPCCASLDMVFCAHRSPPARVVAPQSRFATITCQQVIRLLALPLEVRDFDGLPELPYSIAPEVLLDDARRLLQVDHFVGDEEV